MIDHEHQLSISRQAKLLGISRGSVYYQRRPSSPADLALMHRMDERCTWSIPLPAAGCCAACFGRKALSWAACMSPR